MFRRNLLFAFLINLFCQSSFAYNMGLKFGSTITQHSIEDSMGFRVGSQSMGIGYLVGIFWQNDGEGFGYEVDLLYTRRASVPSSVNTQGITYTIHNLELPAFLKYEWESVFVGAGAYLKNGLGDVRIDGGEVIPASDFSYNKLQLYTLEVGALLAVGTKFETGMGYISLESRFNFGLNNRAKNPSGLSSFSSFAYDLLVGVVF